MTNRKNTSASLFETLETRQLMTWVPTDMSDLASHYPTHSGTTVLYLNFDGGSINDTQAGGQHTIAAYQPSAGFDRAASIRDIVYRTAQIFSPFNVRVKVMSGAGNFAKSGGNTTIFIGDEATHKNSDGKNSEYSVTPSASCDLPCTFKGVDHAPNSDAYDIGFVDPVSFKASTNALATTMTTLAISQCVGHEAGHTFGLAHVLSSPVKDLMSYDTNDNPAFLDQQFNISDLNYDGTATTHTGEFPKVHAVDSSGHAYVQNIYKQNSFAYLRSALGYKDIYVDPHIPFVADKNTISSDYYGVLGNPPVITTADHPSSVLSNFGEYDVYTLNNVVSGKLNAVSSVAAFGKTRISLAIGNPAFDPQIMLYDSTGFSLLASVHGSSLDYALVQNTKYQLVVSGYLGDTAGAYTVNMSRVAPQAAQSLSTTTSARSFPRSASIFSATPVNSGNKDVLTALFA